MNSLNLTVGIVVPMIIMMLCGWLLRVCGALPMSAFQQMNRLSYLLLLPASLLNNLLRMEDLGGLRPGFLAWLLFLQVFLLALLYLTVPRFVSDRRSVASIIQASFRSNFLTFGLVIAQAFCGPEELGIVSVAAGILIPLYNIGSIFILQHGAGGRTPAKDLIRTLATNPFVLVCILGLLRLACRLDVPTPLLDSVGIIGGAAIPVSFLAMGGCTELSRLAHIGGQVAFGTLLRLVFLPAVLIGITWAAGFRGIELLTVIVMAISPTAVATYPMAESMGADGPLAGYLVASQTCFSILTIFVWILGLSSFGLMRV